MSLGNVALGQFSVGTTNNGGFPVDYWADRLLEKIIFISENAPPGIKEQALAYRDQLRPAILHYMEQAVRSDRTTLASKLSLDADILGKL